MPLLKPKPAPAVPLDDLVVQHKAVVAEMFDAVLILRALVVKADGILAKALPLSLKGLRCHPMTWQGHCYSTDGRADVALLDDFLRESADYIGRDVPKFPTNLRH